MTENSEDTQTPRYKGLLDELASRPMDVRSAQARYRVMINPDDWEFPESLEEILGIPSEHLTERAIATLELHEQKAKQSTKYSGWIDFKWKLTAFNEIQDIFGAPLYIGNESPLNVFHLWYFYFESRHLLIEAILCGLQGLYAASNAMLRLFLEFNILQLYYYSISNKTQSYRALEGYFTSGRCPSWNTALQKALPNDAFCRPIKALLDLQLKSLSKSAAHPYHPDFSPRQYSTVGLPSYEGIYFWHLTRLVLHPILWAYYVNFPMVFHPRDILRKFGFGGPIGIFIDKQCAIAIKNSLRGDEYTEFFDYSQSNEDVKSLITWYEDRPDLTEGQIKETWNTESNGDLENIFPQGYGKHMAQLRAFRELLALKRPASKTVPEQVLETYRSFSYNNWKRIYKRYSRREGT